MCCFWYLLGGGGEKYFKPRPQNRYLSESNHAVLVKLEQVVLFVFIGHSYMCHLDILLWIHEFFLSSLLLDHCFALFSWFWNWWCTTVVSKAPAILKPFMSHLL